MRRRTGGARTLPILGSCRRLATGWERGEDRYGPEVLVVLETAE
jgi:hypothetical protein